jgi:hypothetical protein
VQPDRLVDGQEFMKSIAPRRPDAQADIDFCQRFDRDTHGPMIVKSRCQDFAWVPKMIRPRLTPVDWGHLTLSTLAILLSITSSVVFRYKRRGSHYWPSAPGTVEYGLTSDLDGWRTNLVYSYSVNGEFHSGTHTLKARSESHADELAATYKMPTSDRALLSAKSSPVRNTDGRPGAIPARTRISG